LCRRFSYTGVGKPGDCFNRLQLGRGIVWLSRKIPPLLKKEE
jgi:hypothetical protein